MVLEEVKVKVTINLLLVLSQVVSGYSQQLTDAPGGGESPETVLVETNMAGDLNPQVLEKIIQGKVFFK